MYGVEFMRLLNTGNRGDTKVEELDSYRMRDGGVLTLEAHDGLKWSVTYYSRSDIQEWTQEYESYDAARQQFEMRRRTDKGPRPISKTGAKR